MVDVSVGVGCGCAIDSVDLNERAPSFLVDPSGRTPIRGRVGRREQSSFHEIVRGGGEIS